MKYSQKRIRDFYKSSLGIKVTTVLRCVVKNFFSGLMRHKTVLMLGCVETSLCEKLIQKNMILNCILKEFFSGALSKKVEFENSIVVKGNDLPFLNHSMDYVVLLHSLEFVSNDDAFLDEVLRVMNADGELLIIVPNRQGLWSWFDSTPFGFGQPYSMKQLNDLLLSKGLDISSKSHALFLPPSLLNKGYPPLKYLDSLCLKYFKKMSGLNIIHARKRSAVVLMKPVMQEGGIKVKEKY